MIIGVPREIKDQEYRVSLTPGGAAALTRSGHTVLVEAAAGEGSGFSDGEFAAAGAELVSSHASVFERAEMVVKVKEPLPEECALLKNDLILFTFLHLAAAPELAASLMHNDVTAIAYETVELADGSLPLLVPMSEVAGRMSIQVGAHYLEKRNGGRGVLLGGVPGVAPANVVVLGAGTVGSHAARIALGMGANVVLVDLQLARLRHLSEVLHGNLVTLTALQDNVERAVREADLLIGAVLVTGARTPRLVSREMVREMRPGSVIIDVSVDQGGCVETSHLTTHSNPTYFVDGVLHYCVANMPGAVPRSSTFALCNVTLPYVLELANKGFEAAIEQNKALAAGVNLYRGSVTQAAVAAAIGMPFRTLAQVIELGPAKEKGGGRELSSTSMV